MSKPYKEISNALSELLIGRKYSIEPSPNGTSPIFLLLTLKKDKVGFAILNDKPERSYFQSFKKIRELYSTHSSEWADFDLTLVLCKIDGKKIPDKFRNEIEVNPYFCRKFVIDLNKDLKIELGRLPFVPLRPERIVGLKRSISAQTFLSKHGVTSDLARDIVIPHAKGIERIIKECIEGSLGKAEWLKAEIEEFPLPQYEARPKVRLKDLEISNFRAYRKNYKFDLEADLVILFGPNGFGKTSFFDAIDFVCTGGVARFDERFKRKTYRLLNALKHLDSSIDDSFVKATMIIDGKEVSLERYMKNRTQTYINGISKNRTKTLIELTGLSEEPPDFRIENFVRLFRATHLFGQEYQFLTSELREYSRLPEDTVSRMLAFQDYVEAINKTRKVSGELKRQIKEKESEIAFLEDSLKPKENEMRQLRRSAKIIKTPRKILEVGKKLEDKIIEEMNISIEIPRKINLEGVRSWRGIIESQISAITQDLEIIRELESKTPKFVIHREGLGEKNIKYKKKKGSLLQLKKDYSKKKKQFEKFNEKLNEMFLEEKELALKEENFDWLLKVKIEYEKLKQQITKEDRNYRNIQAQLLELLPKIEKFKSENKAAEETVSKILLDIKTLESSKKELTDFEKCIEDWQKAVHRHKELKMYLQRTEQKLVNMKNELRIKKEELNVAIITQDTLRKHIDNLQQSQSRLQTLLDNIEQHILSNICPVCGASYKSREELIEKLKNQRGIQPNRVQETLKLFEGAQVKNDKLEKYVSNLELKIKQLEQKPNETEKELVDIEGKIKSYEEKAITLDIPITHRNLMEVIYSKKKKISRQINIRKQELSEHESRTKMLQEELSLLEKQRGNIERDLQPLKTKQNQLRSMIDKIRSDASARKVSLELGKEKIQSELTTMSSLIENLHKKIDIRQTKNQNLKKGTSNLLEKKNILEREIQESDKLISDSKIYIEEVEGLIKGLNLSLDIDIDQVLLLKKDFNENLSRLGSLRNEITNFEIALDSVEISATFAKIQQDIENIKKQLQHLEKRRDQLKKWLSHFYVICKEMEFLKNRALKEYTDKYGPLTSTIQRRLRSVYGFGDIRLHPEKGEIAVRVERGEERNISPSDYFSESQIQIVMLSLFMSAALTQTWSSFALTLLDDPVEHFDDLNAYSLLDLIRGLIMEPNREHQFIISTCEDRLFRLMRQKFSKMNGRVIFYVFESIGEDGPKIKKL